MTIWPCVVLYAARGWPELIMAPAMTCLWILWARTSVAGDHTIVSTLEAALGGRPPEED